MQPNRTRELPRTLVSFFLSIAMVFSLIPSAALAEVLPEPEGAQTVNTTPSAPQGEPPANEVTEVPTTATELYSGADTEGDSQATSSQAGTGISEGTASADPQPQTGTTGSSGAANPQAESRTSEGTASANPQADANANSGSKPASESRAADNKEAATPAQEAATPEGLEPQVEEPHDINVTVGLPSESNVHNDLHVALTYNDNLFAEKSSVFNNDLAYASTCLAASADNSNEGGNNYSVKSKNVVSFLQQIGCTDIEANEGYKQKPMQGANIGVAIGHKDIHVGDKNYRLFVFGVRGGGYEEEWAVNMRVGTEGDATGFQEARDGALGFIMPYIQAHTKDAKGDLNVKIWGSGYCRGGTTTNMAFGWLNKWVYERNNGKPYQPWNQSYNGEHAVFGASYNASDKRYTEQMSFSPADYLPSNVKITQDDLYAYPVNCPYGADGADVNNHEPIMTGIHNLINPDDWFPQIIMDWWGFKRYGYTHDHDITGTYGEDGSFAERTSSVWDPSNAARQDAVGAMTARLKAVDPSTSFSTTEFRQRYFSKMSVVGNTFKKIGTSIWNGLKSLVGVKSKTPVPDIFQLSIDEKGEGNQFYSKGVELKYKQGAYYQEFMKFLLNAAKFPDDPAAARKYYVENYQDAFFDLATWALGQPLEVREQFGKVGAEQAKVALEQLRTQNSLLSENSSLAGLSSTVFNTTAGKYLHYLVAAIWSANDSSGSLPAALVGRTLQLTLDKLNIAHTQEQINRAATTVGKLAYNFYDKEQGIASFCFFHALTIYKAGSSIAQSHWPEQSLAWFSQCKPSEPSKKEKGSITSQAESTDGLDAQAEVTTHMLYTLFDDDPEYFYDQGIRENGEIVGIVDSSEKYEDESGYIESWNMYSLEGYASGDSPLKVVTEDYAIQADDPQYIVLTPNGGMLASKTVNLWLNKSMTGFDKDVLIGSFDVYEGGNYRIAYHSLAEDQSYEGFDVFYYGGNENLINKEGVTLEGWINDAESVDELTGFLPDDVVSYNQLPEGDVIDLYALWYDPVVYGVTYHANRSSSDTYVVEDAQFTSDEDTLVAQAVNETDEGMQNPGKDFKGWNTAADGSGTWVATNEQVSPSQLGLGDRSQYVSDLQALANLQVEAMPAYANESNGEAEKVAQEFEAQLEPKYTAHLYAQWEEPANPATAPAPAPQRQAAVTTTNVTRAATPSTSDSLAAMTQLGALLAAVGVATLWAARRKRD